MSDTTPLVERYISMWNETDPRRRRALVAETMSEDARYLDPLMSGEGIDGIDRMIAGAQEQFPGHTFRLHSLPDAHHDRIRFSWSLAPEAGAAVAIGTDFATVAEDGRMGQRDGFSGGRSGGVSGERGVLGGPRRALARRSRPRTAFRSPGRKSSGR